MGKRSAPANSEHSHHQPLSDQENSQQSPAPPQREHSKDAHEPEPKPLKEKRCSRCGTGSNTGETDKEQEEHPAGNIPKGLGAIHCLEVTTLRLLVRVPPGCKPYRQDTQHPIPYKDDTLEIRQPDDHAWCERGKSHGTTSVFPGSAGISPAVGTDSLDIIRAIRNGGALHGMLYFQCNDVVDLNSNGNIGGQR